MNNRAENLLIVISIFITFPTLLVGLVGVLLLALLGFASRSNLIKSYAFNIAYSIDQFGNALLLGDPDETISSRTGRAVVSGRAKWFVYPLAWFVNLLFRLIVGQKDHVRESIEYKLTVEKEIWQWEKSDL